MARIFFSVGEPSGDQHAAELIEHLQEFRPEMECVGYGGPHMQEVGCKLDHELTKLAVMGFLRVVPLLWQFYKLVKNAERIFAENPPDAVVLVDFPGFNWWIARKAKRAGIPVFYYLPPQLWAWAPWRIRKMRKFVDHVLCGLPFEPAWYAERGMQVDYVGHPFFDEVATHRLDQPFIDQWRNPDQPETQKLVAILPGSRSHEVTRNFPRQVELMQQVLSTNSKVQFLVASYKPKQKAWCEAYLKDRAIELPIQFYTGKTPEIIELCDCCLMVSGSVSLEMLARKKPALVIYACGAVFYAIARRIVSVSSITLPNLISGRVIIPEFILAGKAKKEMQQAGAILSDWVNQPLTLAKVRQEMESLHADVVQPGATARAAELILNRLPNTLKKIA